MKCFSNKLYIGRLSSQTVRRSVGSVDLEQAALNNVSYLTQKLSSIDGGLMKTSLSIYNELKRV